MFENSYLGLAVSNLCGGKCLFCPKTRGKRLPQTMTFELARKVIDDAVGLGVRKFSIGDNGDALICPAFLGIARYLREKCSDGHITLVTNFQNLTPDLSTILLSERLVDAVVVNIDGATAESYERCKGLNYDNMCRNVEAFLSLRDRFRSPAELRIDSVPYAWYRACVMNAFGRLPECLEKDDLPYDGNSIYKKWRPKLRDTDQISRATPYAWALRELCTKDPKQFECFFLKDIEEVGYIHIAPNGDFYPCCWMDDQTIVLGNLAESTIMEVVNGEKRRVFIERLKNREYEKIGYPCTKVECCRYIGIGKDGP